jgi:hypothetical protein
MRAVGMYYGPTRVYRPTGHAIEGTAQQALRSLTTADIDAGPRHYQRRLRACRTRSSRRMNLASYHTGARVTRMSLLWVGKSSWRTWTGATPCYGDRQLRDRREQVDASA